MEVFNLLGSTLGLGLVSGLNLYATVLTVGLGVRLGLITLNPEMSGLAVLSNPYVLIAAGILFVVEFLADKIQWVDSVWDTVHTFIRPVAAALVGASAIGAVNAEAAVIAALCAGVSLSAHSTKAGTRLLANHSPEPFSNIGLSLIEDGLAVAGTWIALRYPSVMLVIVAVFLIAFAWFAPRAFRLLRVEYHATRALLKQFYLRVKQYVSGERRSKPAGSDVSIPFEIRCVAGKGVKRLRHSIGHLQIDDETLIFVTRRGFRAREHRIDRDTIQDIHFRKRMLLDRLAITTDGKQQHFHFFKDIANHSQRAYELLRAHKKQDVVSDSAGQSAQLNARSLATPASSQRL
jgi:hypothetical protein